MQPIGCYLVALMQPIGYPKKGGKIVSQKKNAPFIRLRRQQIDRQLTKVIPYLREFKRPAVGWIKEIRGALGMTSAQLAKRLGVSRQMLQKIEAGELSGAVTLSTLQRAAEALGFRVSYVLLPLETAKKGSTQPLEELVNQQAYEAAKRIITRVSISMELEQQKVSETVQERQIRALAEDMIKSADSKIWE